MRIASETDLVNQQIGTKSTESVLIEKLERLQKRAAELRQTDLNNTQTKANVSQSNQ